MKQLPMPLKWGRSSFERQQDGKCRYIFREYDDCDDTILAALDYGADLYDPANLDKIVGQATADDYEWDCARFEMTDEHRKAILHAVNSHDALVEAVRTAAVAGRLEVNLGNKSWQIIVDALDTLLAKDAEVV